MIALAYAPTWASDRESLVAAKVFPALSPTRPIWVGSAGRNCVTEPTPAVRGAALALPYCEVNFTHAGRRLQHIGFQSMECRKGDMLLVGPGTPHRAEQLSAEHRTTSVLFLPRLLLEMGPEGDGARLLARCCNAKDISEQVFRLTPSVTERMSRRFDDILREFQQGEAGYELLLRSLLIEILVDLSRGESRRDVPEAPNLDAIRWIPVQKAVRFVHEKFAEPIYVRDLAAAAGVSAARLQESLQATLGMSGMKYLQWCRLSRAQALLSAPDTRIGKVALEVGFETLSHFNAAFRKMVGVSPTEFIRRHQRARQPAGSVSPEMAGGRVPDLLHIDVTEKCAIAAEGCVPSMLRSTGEKNLRPQWGPCSNKCDSRLRRYESAYRVIIFSCRSIQARFIAKQCYFSGKTGSGVNGLGVIWTYLGVVAQSLARRQGHAGAAGN
jgi:AraC-like DNA-binding protein